MWVKLPFSNSNPSTAVPMIEILYSVWIFSVTVVVAIGVAMHLRVSVSRCMALFMWHTAFCLAYYQYCQDTCDTLFYYEAGLAGDNIFAVGTSFIVWFTEMLVKWLGFSYFDTFILFNLFGFFGVLLLDASLNQILHATKYSQSIYVWIPFLPGLNYWSSALGKDGIAFTSATLAIYGSMDIQKRKIFLASSLFFMFLVRPHTALMMAVAAAIAAFAGSKQPLSTRLIVIASATLFVVIATPFVLEYIGRGHGITNADDAIDAIEESQGYNLEGGGGVDISRLSLPGQLFTYLFRPLFIDAPGMTGTIASIENVVLLIVFFMSLPPLYKLLRSDRSFFCVFNFSYFLIGWILAAMITANLGISNRQKWMILPAFLIISVFATVAQRGRTRATEGGRARLDSPPR